MIRRGVKIQLVAFIILALAGVTYTGARYLGVRTPFQPGPYTVVAHFRDSGGIFTGAEVTNRGVTVGKVGAMHVAADGVAVDLMIQPSDDKIPADTRAVVGNLSAVGEQYVNLEPQTDSGPYLHAGSTIPVSQTAIPISDATLLLNLDKLVNSVPKGDLGVVIDELGKAFNGVGPDLSRLIQSGNALTQAAQNALPQTVQLINDGKTVLDTQNAASGEIKTFAANLAGLSQQIATSDPDIRRLFDGGTQSAQQLQSLLEMNQGTLPAFLDNLGTLGEIQAARIPGLKSMLVLYPMNVANGFLAAAGGYAHFGLVNTNNPPVCNSGYQSTKRRANTPPNWGGPANLAITCTPPDQGGPGNPNGSAVRGANNAPRPPGDTTKTDYTGKNEGYAHSVPPPASGGSASGSGGSSSARTGGAQGTAAGAPTVAPYDPLSGLLMAPNGQAYQLGDQGGQQQLLGSRSWEWLLLAPASG